MKKFKILWLPAFFLIMQIMKVNAAKYAQWK